MGISPVNFHVIKDFHYVATCDVCDQPMADNEPMRGGWYHKGDVPRVFIRGHEMCLDSAGAITSDYFGAVSIEVQIEAGRCPACDREVDVDYYDKRTNKRQFCSPKCQRQHQRDQHRDLSPRACVVCEREFIPKRNDARYCSGACRVRLHRQKAQVSA